MAADSYTPNAQLFGVTQLHSSSASLGTELEVSCFRVLLDNTSGGPLTGTSNFSIRLLMMMSTKGPSVTLEVVGMHK